VYHVGFTGYSNYGSGELATLTAAYEHARSLALGRLQQEATLLRAHAGDRRALSSGVNSSGAKRCFEFQAIGTAVRLAGAAVPEARGAHSAQCRRSL